MLSKMGVVGVCRKQKNACHFVVCVLMLLYGELQMYIFVNDSLIIFCKKICGDGGYVLLVLAKNFRIECCFFLNDAA